MGYFEVSRSAKLQRDVSATVSVMVSVCVVWRVRLSGSGWTVLFRHSVESKTVVGHSMKIWYCRCCNHVVVVVVFVERMNE